MAERTVIEHRCKRCGAVVPGTSVAEGRKPEAATAAVKRALADTVSVAGVRWHTCADGDGAGLLEVAGYGYVGQ